MMLGFGIVFAGPGDVLLLAVAAVAVLMLVAWAASVAVRDVSIIDPVWGPAFVVVAVVAGLAGSGDAARRWLLVGLIGVWGLRLGLYLTSRKLVEPGEDRRYTRMRKYHSNFALWSLGWIFGLQGALVLIVSLPLQVAARRPDTLSLWIVPGLVLYAVGIVFEATGDEQLRRFKSDPANKGQVMDRGLWRYTRHPNYFGDACVWWGVWLVVLQGGGSWWTAIGPAVMTVLLVRVSGAALLEQDIGKRRPGYAEYIRRTSGFLPRPPRD